MARSYRLGIAGLVHDHVWKELAHWAATGRVEFVAAADANPRLTARAQKEFGVAKLFDNPQQMFDECELDVVQVCTSNAAGAEVVEAAAKRGVHAVIEKPLAATLAQAERMLAAAGQGRIRLLVNWPFRWRAETPQAWKLVADGAIGHVFNARIRMAHRGPKEFGCSDDFCGWLFDASQNGGGALIDYCCYGAVAFCHLFGKPKAVQAVAGRFTKQDIAVEDNAAITLLYDDRFVTTEASWSQIPAYHDAAYLGTEGTLWTDRGKIWIARDEDHREEIPVQPFPPGERNLPEWFITLMDAGQPPGDVCLPEVCRDAQEILEAGLRAAETGHRIGLPLAKETP